MENIIEGKLLELMQAQAAERESNTEVSNWNTKAALKSGNPVKDNPFTLKPLPFFMSARFSEDDVHSDGEIMEKAKYKSQSKQLQTKKPRRNSTVSNLKEMNLSAEKRRSFSARRSLSVPELDLDKKPFVFYSVTHDKNKRQLKISSLKVVDLSLSLLSREYVHVQCDLIPLQMQKATGTLPWSPDLHFDDDLVFEETEQSEFSKITILLTVYNGNEDRTKGHPIAEVGYHLSNIHFRGDQPVGMRHMLQAGKKVKRVS